MIVFLTIISTKYENLKKCIVGAVPEIRTRTSGYDSSFQNCGIKTCSLGSGSENEEPVSLVPNFGVGT